MSVAVIGGAIGQWPLGHLSDLVDRRKVIILAAIGAAASGIGMVLFGQVLNGGLLLFAFAFGLFAFPLYAISVAHLNDFVSPTDYVEAAGGLLLVFAVGAVAGPLIASWIIGNFGINSLFGYTALIHLGFAAFAFYRIGQRDPVPEEDQIAFKDALVMAETVSTTDPLQSGSDTDMANENIAAAMTSGSRYKV